MSTEQVSVIIPTLALPERRRLLDRALASVVDQEGVTAIPIVVVNGAEFDPTLVEELGRDRRLRLIVQPAADLPSALRLGWTQVATPWFTSLDDDDELVPGALALRVRALTAADGCDAIVTNGYRSGDGVDGLAVADMRTVASAPLDALIQSNWLLPGAWLCRTDPASHLLFDGMPSFLECTYLAIRLCTCRKVRFVDEPTVIWHAGSPRSLSSSRAYRFGQQAALRRILQLDLPANLRKCFRRRLSGAYHDAAGLLLNEGRTSAAWAHHARSLLGHQGWRFLLYTRKLVGHSIGLRRQPA